MKTNFFSSLVIAIVLFVINTNVNAQISNDTGARISSNSIDSTESFIYNINGTLDVVRGAINLCTNSGSGANTTQYVKFNIGAKGVVNCSDYVRKHIGKAGQSIVVRVASGGTIVYSGKSYTTNQCTIGTGLTSDVSSNEVTNSLLAVANNQNLTFVNTSDVTLAGDSTINIKGDLTQSSNLLGKALFFNGSSTQIINAGNKSVSDLIINTTGGNVALSSALTVNGILNLTAGNLNLGDNNLTIVSGGFVSDGSAASHIVTNGAGELIQTVTTSGAAFPIGASATSYDPAVIKPRISKVFSIKVYTSLTGTPNAGISYNPREWNITSEATTGTDITLTPSVLKFTGNPVISYYSSGIWSNVSATFDGTSYKGKFYSFSSPFSTGGMTVSALEIPNYYFTYYVNNKQLFVKGLSIGDVLSVFSLNGSLITKTIATGNMTSISLNKTGIYFVKVTSNSAVNTFKVLVI